MNTKKLQHISLALTLSLLVLVGVLALLGAGNGGPLPVYAQGPDEHETYYVAPDCSGLSVTPCYTTVQAAVDAVDDPGDEIRVAMGMYTDVNTHGGLAQIAYISKTLTLRGGYNTDFSVWDPDVYPTTLDAGGAGRAMYITGSTITPTVEGFTLTSGDDTGLGGGYSGRDAGAGMYIRNTPVAIRRCIIEDNHSNNSGGGIYLYHSAAQISYVIIRNNSGLWGGGMHLDASPATISDSTIELNSAPGRNGGGIYASQSTFTARDNLIQNNTSEAGGGLYVVGADDSLIEANTIQSNTATWTGGGMYVQGSQNVALTGNTFQYNVAQYTGSSSGSGGGLVMYCGGPHTLQDNIFHANTAERTGGGIYFAWCSSIYNYATMTNNVFVDNQAAQEGGAIYSSSGGETSILHTTLAHNQGLSGIYVSGSTLVFTNTIVYSHTVGVNNASGTVSMALTLWDNNDTDMAGTVDTVGDISGTAAFDSDGYHLTAASDAIDQGVDAGVTDDIDGELRPMRSAADLGADEYPYHVDLAISKTRQGSGAVNAGDMLTYTLTITNAAASEIMADARVVDTVEPASAVASLSGSTPGGDCTTAGAVITCDLYNIVTDTMRTLTVWVTPTATYDGILTNTATVTPTNALDSDDADNAAGPITTTIIYVPPFPDLWVNKTAPAYAEPGETIVYSVTWGNSGSLIATGAILTDTLPGGVTFVAANPPQDSGPNPLVWNLGDVAPGASGTHTVTVTVNGGLSDGTVLTNTVLIAADTFSDTAVAATTIYQLGGYDLKLHKEIIGGGGTYEYGSEVYYKITISNTGQLAANIDLLDEIPAGTAYIPGSVQANGDGTTQSLTDDNGKIRWLGDMGAGGVEVISFGVTVISPQGVDCGTVRNEAHAIIPGVSYQWESQVDFHVLSPDLGVSIDAPQYAARESESVMDAYPIIVTYQNDNNHLYPGDAYTTVLTVTLPNNNALLWESDPAPTQQNSGQEWVWTLGTIVEGVEQSIEITIQPSPATAGNDYLVRAEIGSQTPECCQPNQPEEADAHTYMVDMHFQKSAAAPKQHWGVDSMGKPVSRVTQDYYLEFQHQNADPNAPNADPYRVDDTLPADLDLNTATWNPVMDTNVIDFQHVTFSSLQPLHTADRAWIRMNATADNLPAGQVLTNHATLSYAINGENLSASAEAASTVPMYPPLITYPGDGDFCGDEFGQVEVRGVAQPNAMVKLFGDTGSGFDEESSVTADMDGNFTVWSFSPIPEGLTSSLKLYTQACDPANPTDCSAPSNQVEVWYPQADWCPQLSYWEGTIKAGPLKGQNHRLDGFRNSDGLYSTWDWVSPGVYGFWDTDLYIYACCNSAAEIVVTADGVEYQPVGINGRWHHFQIGGAHDVEICSSCDSEEPVCTDGDILIDPDGYVFNVDEGGDYSGEGGMFAPVEAISGVTVTCMVSMPQWGGWVPWPAHLYEDQVNPQVTDDVYPDNITTTGYYAFFTPPGFYYIDVEGIDGYQHWRSPVVQVITEIVHVNVPYTPWPDQVAISVTLTAQGISSPVIAIPVGSAVEWVSMLTATDTITDLIAWSENPILHPKSDLDPLENVQGFDAGYLEPGRVYRRTFAWPGTYAYTDANGNTGTVIVTGEPPYKYIYLPLVLKNYAP
jgi:uncharacterized repeat protein (TIGR01451 family)